MVHFVPGKRIVPELTTGLHSSNTRQAEILSGVFLIK